MGARMGAHLLSRMVLEEPALEPPREELNRTFSKLSEIAAELAVRNARGGRDAAVFPKTVAAGSSGSGAWKEKTGKRLEKGSPVEMQKALSVFAEDVDLLEAFKTAENDFERGKRQPPRALAASGQAPPSPFRLCSQHAAKHPPWEFSLRQVGKGDPRPRRSGALLF